MTFSHPRMMIFQKRKYNFTVMCITPRLNLNSADAVNVYVIKKGDEILHL